MSRTRTSSYGHKNGSVKRFGTKYEGAQITDWNGTCTDMPGFGLGDNLPFQVDSASYKGGGVINAIIKDGGSYYSPYFDEYVADAFTFSGMPLFPQILTYPGEQSSAAYAAMALARTNPSRPYVDAIQNVLEIGDIPRTLKVYGETLIEKLAENYLRYNFGIRPLVKDISRLINWAELVHRKLDIIDQLRKTGGYRKTVTLDKLSASQVNSNVTLQSFMGIFTDTYETIGSRTIRGHVRYVPSVDYSKYSQAEMCALAKRAVIGLEWNLSGLWEGLPWSWLIDWYTNIGDLLSQTRNVIPVTASDVHLMRHTTSISTTHKLIVGATWMSPGTVVKERKERYPASATLDAHLPFLSAGQMGILASLLVMKHKYVSPR
jgi:hypothetical protein